MARKKVDPEFLSDVGRRALVGSHRNLVVSILAQVRVLISQGAETEAEHLQNKVRYRFQAVISL